MSDVGLFQEPSSDPPTGQIDREKATLTLFLSLPPSLTDSLSHSLSLSPPPSSLIAKVSTPPTVAGRRRSVGLEVHACLTELNDFSASDPEMKPLNR